MYYHKAKEAWSSTRSRRASNMIMLVSAAITLVIGLISIESIYFLGKAIGELVDGHFATVTASTLILAAWAYLGFVANPKKAWPRRLVATILVAFVFGGVFIAVEEANAQDDCIFEGFDPSLSPDGTQIVYVNVTDTAQLFIGNLATCQTVQFSDSSDPLITPAWSPDGEWIAFSKILESGINKTYITPAGEFRHQFVANGSNPSWNPTSNQLAVDRYSGGSFHIFLIDLNSGGESQLTYGPGNNFNPTWSPDGEWVAFEFLPFEGHGDIGIYRIRPDGSNQRLVADYYNTDQANPTWSSDGKAVIYTNLAAAGEIYDTITKIDLDDSSETILIPLPINFNLIPSTDTAGNMIAVTTVRDEKIVIVIATLD